MEDDIFEILKAMSPHVLHLTLNTPVSGVSAQIYVFGEFLRNSSQPGHSLL